MTLSPYIVMSTPSDSSPLTVTKHQKLYSAQRAHKALENTESGHHGNNILHFSNVDCKYFLTYRAAKRAKCDRK